MMQIKDENGKVIANIDLSEGYSLNDLIRCTNKKSNNKRLNNLEKIEESENKKQIVFCFSDGDLFYDLPTKKFLRDNGSIVGENSLCKFNLNIEAKEVKCGWNICANTFWLELTKKTDVAWIKTFFKIVDVWTNQRFNSNHITKRVITNRCKIQRLIDDKKFFDSVESFAKLDKVQFLAQCESYEPSQNLIDFYRNIHDISKNINEKKHNIDAIYINIGKAKLDSWFLSNMAKSISGEYVRSEYPYSREDTINKTLSNYLGDYVKCVDNNIKDLFQYVYETYRGVIAYKQIEKIKYLIKFGYEPKRLMDYLYRDIQLQGLDLDLDSNWSNSIGALGMLYDYAKMNEDIETDYEKYPRYLSTYHDIAQKNYEVEKDKILCKKFTESVKILKKSKFEYSDGDYCIILPKNGDDLIKEGQSMKHCVASYYSRFAERETIIVFMRNKNNIKESLVTIEVDENNNIIQAKGMNNKTPIKCEIEFIEKYKKYLSTLQNPYKIVA